jgi:hypothetical protein
VYSATGFLPSRSLPIYSDASLQAVSEAAALA